MRYPSEKGNPVGIFLFDFRTTADNIVTDDSEV